MTHRNGSRKVACVRRMAGIFSEIKFGRIERGASTSYQKCVKCFRKRDVEAELGLGPTQATRLLLPNEILCNTPILLIASITGLLQAKGVFRTLLALKDLLFNPFILPQSRTWALYD